MNPQQTPNQPNPPGNQPPSPAQPVPNQPMPSPAPQPPFPSTHQAIPQQQTPMPNQSVPGQPHMTAKDLSPAARRLFGMIEFDQDEKLMCEIRKHPFGLFVIYITGFVIAAVAILISFLLGNLFISDVATVAGSNPNQMRALIATIGFVVAGFVILITLIGGFIYRSNVILVTNEKIAQVIYHNIIDRKISQLSIGDIQDVTVRQDGLFARIFHFGTLVVETAGEQQNYTFTFVPAPYKISKDIVGAHEQNLKQFGN